MKERVSSYGSASEQAQIPIPRDKRGRIQWRLLKGDVNQLRSVIEFHASSLISEGSPLNREAFKKAGLHSIDAAITRYYPDGMLGLKINLGLQPDKRPKSYWTNETIEEETRIFLEGRAEGKNRLTQRLLQGNGRSDLASAITNHYPGGMYVLRERLGYTNERKPVGYWTQEKIEEEARAFFEQEGELTQSLLFQKDRQDLSTQIKHYPGGATQLRIKIGAKILRKNGYWTEEQIESDTSQFLQEYDGITENLLTIHKRQDLLGAIRQYYPGGLIRLKERLGLIPKNKPVGYWTTERIEEETLAFLNQFGILTPGELKKNGRQDLIGAINEHYPGAFTKLKEHLGIGPDRRSNGHWRNPKNVEEEARILLDNGYSIANKDLRAEHSGFISAVRKYYPGGLIALREKLGIANGERLILISPDEANEQLRRLLEEKDE